MVVGRVAGRVAAMVVGMAVTSAATVTIADAARAVATRRRGRGTTAAGAHVATAETPKPVESDE